MASRQFWILFGTICAMPKRVAPLSVKRLASVRPGPKPIELVDGYVPGLRIRILPSGTTSVVT